MTRWTTYPQTCQQSACEQQPEASFVSELLQTELLPLDLQAKVESLKQDESTNSHVTVCGHRILANLSVLQRPKKWLVLFLEDVFCEDKYTNGGFLKRGRNKGQETMVEQQD